MTPPDPRRAVDFIQDANALEAVKRTGFVMCGVEDPEDVAAHTTGMAAAAMMIADRVAEPVDRGRVLLMTLLHDIGESRTGDVPLIHKTPEDDEREERAADEILAGLPPLYAAALDEYRAQESTEARIVKAADKLQMMAKILTYQAEGRGNLDAFWKNDRNFNDAGLPAARELYDEIRRRHES